ncbi:Hypp2449 [Branchiostoma lanceolatum]|uniref:Hypp2449 protein n=1 Tax=Branchiostoma lanceolatum TaxID=7740 RepID=A0A8K0ESG4_BRALA|nr:Hypp2449 [Branchiostoma lanceolatum]
MPLVDLERIRRKLQHYFDPDRLALIWEEAVDSFLGCRFVDLPLKWACVWCCAYHMFSDAPTPVVLTSGLVMWELTILALALLGDITFEEFDRALDRVREQRNCMPEPDEPMVWTSSNREEKKKKKVKAGEEKDKAFCDRFQKIVPTVRVFLHDIDKAREWVTWLQLFERKNDIKHDLDDEHAWTEERWKAVEEDVMTRLVEGVIRVRACPPARRFPVI